MEKPSTNPVNTENEAHAGPVQRVAIDRIRCYEHNPRRAQNPEYERIRDSIREQGIDQPLVITRRPGETDFLTYAGGNTRLQILKALFEETGDARFFQAPCVFKPWRQESDVLLAHLRENDLRGSLTFIDKARAVRNVRQMIEAESGEPLSQRRLASQLDAQGYRLSQSLICLMEYAVERLLPQMPQALEAGVGRHQIERLRNLEQATGQLWKHYRLGSESEFAEIFDTLCQRNDGADWELELLRIALETELAETADTDIHRVRMELDAVLAGRPLAPFLPEPEPVDCDMAAIDRPGDQEREAAADAMTASLTTEGSQTDVQDESVNHRGHREHLIHNDLKSLRARAWTLAARLAQRNGMAALIKPAMSQGMGFVVKDVPDPALANQLDPSTQQRVCTLWWHLADCADLLNAPVHILLELLEDNSQLKAVLREQGELAVKQLVAVPAPGEIGQCLWQHLGDADWQDYLDLMDTYRRIHRLAVDHQHALWG